MERIQKIIFEQAERSPDADAVEYDGARLSYAELRRLSLRVSRALVGLGLKPGQAVGLYQERSLSTLPLLLGAWDAGAVVVPINPNVPAKMLEWIIQTSSPRFVLTDAGLAERITETASGLACACTPVISAELLSEDEVAGAQDAPAALAAAAGAAEGLSADACYIIYTSGSQGRPKGVVGSHRSLIHYVRWQAEAFSVEESDRFSQIAPLSFDFSLKELLVPLIRGACVCIADRNRVVVDPEKFVAWVKRSRITVMCCVPTLVRSILQLPDAAIPEGAFDSVRQFLISGDMLRWDDVLGWRRRFGNSTALFNLYGPTESTVIKLCYVIPEERHEGSLNVPVGRPISGSEVLVLDEKGEPCAPGQTGEVVILSDWLASGYVGVAQNNDSAFCLIPRDGVEARAYRTGDLGRLLGSGDLELVGRKDRQVKIRGYRIELDEIESVLAEHEGVREVAVLVPEDSRNAEGDAAPVIACYYTSNGTVVTEKELSAFARERLLPQVMSLTRFMRLEELPLLPNGKVDRLKLQSLAVQEEGATTHAESGTERPLRQRITALWEELLSLERIDLEATFFELGGDSMTAIRLLRRLREEVHPEIKLGDVYAYPSVSQLSARVESLLSEAR